MDVITLTAWDNVPLTATTCIMVQVDDNLDLPGPTLSAGPMQFGWHFSWNASPNQTDQLALDNAGGGTLNWIAGTDAPWLQLSASSGAAPASLTLTASPAGYPNGTAHIGHIFLSIQGSAAPPLVIPVGMSEGGSASAPPHLEFQLFLPSVSH